MTRVLELSRICQRFGVALLYVFGSRAKEVQQWLMEDKSLLDPGGSDVDVGVRPERGCLHRVMKRVELADEYELYLLRRAGDLAPLERERMAMILGAEP